MTRQPEADDAVVDVGQYLRVLRDHKLLLAAGLLVGLLLGIGAAYFSGSSYTAQSEVVVAPIGGNDFLDSGSNVDIATQQQIAASSGVAERVAEDLQEEGDPEDLLDGLVVSVPNNSNVLAFAYTASDARTAEVRAQAFADAYLEGRAQQALNAIADVVSSTETNLAGIQGDLVDVGNDLSVATDGSAAQRDAEVRQNLLLSQASNVQARLTQLNTLVVEPGTVIQRADTATSANGLTRAALLLSFAFLGLLLAVVVAFLRARNDQRMRDDDDVRRAAQATVLASFGAVGAGHGQPRQVLAARLLIAARSAPRRTLALASVDGTAPSAGVVAQVARAMASQGARPAVVDATGRVAVDGAVATVVPVRRTAEGDVDLGGIAEAVSTARAGHDVVLLAADPVLDAADALLVAGESDGVVLVARLGATRRDDLAEASSQLRDTGSPVLGVVLVDGTAPTGEGRASRRGSEQPTSRDSLAPADAR